MEELIENELTERIERILPRSCNVLAVQLRKWIDIGTTSHSESLILDPDGSMNEELFALISLAHAYFTLAGASPESWQNLCLLQARVAILKSCLGVLRNQLDNTNLEAEKLETNKGATR